MGDIDSCYREVIMVVCLVNQEQELQIVQSVMRTLEQLKTRTVDLVARLSYRSIAQKRVGLYVQPVLLSVGTVVRKSRLLRARTSNTAIWSAEIKDISIKQASEQGRGKATKHPIQQYTNGFIHTIRSQMFANIVKGKVTQNGQTYHRSIIENVMTGLIFVNLVTLSLMARTTRTLEDINSVIRKRYAKFIDPNGWEESWQTMTPAIN